MHLEFALELCTKIRVFWVVKDNSNRKKKRNCDKEKYFADIFWIILIHLFCVHLDYISSFT